MSLEKKNDLIKAIEHQLQGMTVEEGEEYQSKNEFMNEGHRVLAIRPMCIDGEEMMGTMDFREDRVNVVVAAEMILEVRSIS